MRLAEARDNIRRRLGIVVPIDTTLTNAQAGDAPSWDPHPSNALLDQIIREACSYITTECGITDTGNVISVSVAAQTASVPYLVELSNLPGVPSNQVVTVKAAWWADSTGSGDRPLYPQSFAARERVSWRDWSRAVGLPAWYAVDSYRVYIMPGPEAAGTLKLRVGLGLLAPDDDISHFHGIPEDLVPRVLDVADFLLASVTPADVDMAARLPAFKLRCDDAVDALKRWWNGQNEGYQPRLIARVGRR